MGIGRTGVEIVGHCSPSAVKVFIDNPRGVVGVEHQTVRDDIVGWVPRIERRTCTIHEPKHLWTLLAVKHTAAVRVRIGPIRTRLVLNGVWNAVPVKVIGLDVVARVVFGIGAVEVFGSVINTSLIGVERVVTGHPNVGRAVGDADVNQVTPRGVFEVIVDAIVVIIQQIGARFVRVGVVADLFKIVHSVTVAVGKARVGEPSKRTEQFLPVR